MQVSIPPLAPHSCHPQLNLHVDSEELSLTTKVLRGAATAGKHLLTINNFMTAFNIVKQNFHLIDRNFQQTNTSLSEYISLFYLFFIFLVNLNQ